MLKLETLWLEKPEMKLGVLIMNMDMGKLGNGLSYITNPEFERVLERELEALNEKVFYEDLPESGGTEDEGVLSDRYWT